jgi:hypothetical protein
MQLQYTKWGGGGCIHLHHESTADGVKGVGEDSSSGSDSLSDGPLGNEVGVLLVLKEDSLGCVVQAEVGSSVHDDTLQIPETSLPRSRH